MSIRKVLALGLAVKGIAILGSTLYLAKKKYEEEKNKNAKFDKALPYHESLYKLKNNDKEIKIILKDFESFLTSVSGLGVREKEEKEVDLNRCEKISLNLIGTGFKDVNISEATEQKGYYNIIFSRDKNFKTNVVLRITMDYWDGYIDLDICQLSGHLINGENVFTVEEQYNTNLNIAGKDDFLYFEFDYTNSFARENKHDPFVKMINTDHAVSFLFTKY